VKHLSLVAAVVAASWACAAQAAGPDHYSIHNPASSQFAIDGDSRRRFGILSTLGFGTEVGPVDNFAAEIEQLIDELDRDDISLSEGTSLVDHFNAILPAIGRDGYVKLQGAVQVPLFPVLLRTDHGVYSLDANLAAHAKLSVLDAPLTFNPLSEELETPTSAYVKGAALTEIALGFSRPVWARDARRVVVGGKARYLRAALSKQVVALESAEDSDEAVDLVKESYDANEHASQALTADVGAIYDAPHYHLGLTLANLTEPEFDYGAIGTNCAAYSGDAQYNCYSAAYFADRIALHETWTLERLATLEAGLQFAGGAGSLNASVNLNEVHDPVGDLNQNAHLAVGYRTRTPWLPDFRASYRRNLAGTQLSTATVGVSFFGAVHLDVACGLEKTLIEGRSVPRTFGINLGFEFSR
jgi:hypothetical protein